MAMPTFTMRQLLEAGIHFGHKTRRWNPKVDQYLYGSRGGIHIIDLQQTVPMLHAALNATRDVVAQGGKVLFVGTKRQASEKVRNAAELCGQYFVNHRWLGGMLTNWKTITKSITRLNELDAQFAEEAAGFTKKELLKLTRERDKLELTLGGIREMHGTPSILFVIDTNKEEIAIKEANRLGIPVVAVVDSNSNPDGVDYIIPGNDDATRAIELYCNLISAAVLDGLQEQLQHSGVDTGAAEEVVIEITEEEISAAEGKGGKLEATPAKKTSTKKNEAALEEKPQKASANTKEKLTKEEPAKEEKKPAAKKATAKKAPVKKTADNKKEKEPATKKAPAKKAAAKKDESVKEEKKPAAKKAASSKKKADAPKAAEA